MIDKQTEPKKTVWISCRANEKCPGNQAENISSRTNRPVGAISIGSFNAEQGGTFTRYRCLTCKGVFQITT